METKREQGVRELIAKGKVGWMDSTDFSCELGHALGGNTVHPDEADCKRIHKCIEGSVGEDYQCFAKRVIVFDADELEAALTASEPGQALRKELLVGDEVWLKGKILEIVEPYHRGIGVDVTVGEKNFSFPIWCDASVLAVCVSSAQPAEPGQPPLIGAKDCCPACGGTGKAQQEPTVRDQLNQMFGKEKVDYAIAEAERKRKP